MATPAFHGSKTFTNSSANLSTYGKVIASAPSGNPREKKSVLGLFASIALSGSVTPDEEATIELALTDGVAVFARRSLTVRITSKRAGLAGSSGAFLCDVIDPATQRNVSDLIGANQTPNGQGDLYWMIGLTDKSGITGFTSMTVQWVCEPVL